MSILPVARILPPDVRSQLMEASKIESRMEFGESPLRAIVLDATIDTIRKNNPQYFQQEK